MTWSRRVLAVLGVWLLPLAASAGVTGSLQGGGGHDELQNGHQLTGVRVQPHAAVEVLTLRGVGSVPNRHATVFNLLVGLSF